MHQHLQLGCQIIYLDVRTCCTGATTLRPSAGGPGGPRKRRVSGSGKAAPSLAMMAKPSIKNLLQSLYPGVQLKEEMHMQPHLIAALKSMGAAVGSQFQILDTHKTGYLKNPTALVDCSIMAADVVSWVQLVSPWEFKVSDSLPPVLGQLVERCHHLFSRQPSRQVAFAVAITLTSVQLFCFQRPQADRPMKVERTDWLPFCISAEDLGFGMLNSLLLTPSVSLGLTPPSIPKITFGEHQPVEYVLLQQGMSGLGGGSFVYRVRNGEEFAVVKLNTERGDRTEVCVNLC